MGPLPLAFGADHVGTHRPGFSYSFVCIASTRCSTSARQRDFDGLGEAKRKRCSQGKGGETRWNGSESSRKR